MLFPSELRMRYKSRSDSLLSSERSLEDVVFASASIQTTFPFRERSRRLRALCLRISYFLLHSPSLRQSSPAPPDLPDQFDCMSTGNLAVSPLRREAAFSPEARRSAVCHMAPFAQIPNDGPREAKQVPPGASHSFLYKFDISFRPRRNF